MVRSPSNWAKSCVEYRIVVDPALEASGKMTGARAADIVHRASAAWSAVQCPSANAAPRPVAIRTVDVAQDTCSSTHGAVHNEVRFTTEPSDGDALAVTDVRFDADNGGVVTAVTRIFDVYADLGKTPAEVDPHVEYIVRHELGHFLGLAHSEQKDAVMNAQFRTRPNEGLSDDDVRGLCDAYNADAPIGAGCDVTDRSRGGSWGAALIGLGTLVLVRRRRAAMLTLVGLVGSLVLMATPANAAGAPTRKTTTSKSASSKPTKVVKKAGPATQAGPSDEELARAPETIPEPKPPSSSPSLSSAVQPNAASSGRDVDRAPAPPEPDVIAPSPRTTDVYLGGGYRAFVLPRAMVAIIGRANKDPIFHAVSAQAELHGKNGFSLVPTLSFADLSTGDMLVGSRSSDSAGSFSYVKSDLKAVAASIELVWSLPVSRRVELELGLELGVGMTFGRLVDSWVHETADGSLEYGGRRFSPCKTVNDGTGCRPQDHGSPTPIRVGDYHEPGLFSGGSAPTLLPWVSLPLVGVRTRVTDDVALRIGVGASVTGVWAGASLGHAVAHRSSP